MPGLHDFPLVIWQISISGQAHSDRVQKVREEGK